MLMCEGRKRSKTAGHLSRRRNKNGRRRGINPVEKSRCQLSQPTARCEVLEECLVYDDVVSVRRAS
jgi:hypothetical protein